MKIADGSTILVHHTTIQISDTRRCFRSFQRGIKRIDRKLVAQNFGLAHYKPKIVTRQTSKRGYFDFRISGLRETSPRVTSSWRRRLQNYFFEFFCENG